MIKTLLSACCFIPFTVYLIYICITGQPEDFLLTLFVMPIFITVLMQIVFLIAYICKWLRKVQIHCAIPAASFTGAFVYVFYRFYDAHKHIIYFEHGRWVQIPDSFALFMAGIFGPVFLSPFFLAAAITTAGIYGTYFKPPVARPSVSGKLLFDESANQS